jgi:hypothetical protein
MVMVNWCQQGWHWCKGCQQGTCRQRNRWQKDGWQGVHRQSCHQHEGHRQVGFRQEYCKQEICQQAHHWQVNCWQVCVCKISNNKRVVEKWDVNKSAIDERGIAKKVVDIGKKIYPIVVNVVESTIKQVIVNNERVLGSIIPFRE